MLITAFDHIVSDLDELKKMLEKSLPDHEFKGFSEFKDCIEFSAVHKPEIVFIENIEGDAWFLIAEAVKLLKDTDPGMQFIIMHWSDIKKSEYLWALGSGSVSFLQKPISYDELEKTLSALVTL